MSSNSITFQEKHSSLIQKLRKKSFSYRQNNAPKPSITNIFAIDSHSNSDTIHSKNINNPDTFLPNLSENGRSLLMGFYDGIYTTEAHIYRKVRTKSNQKRYKKVSQSYCDADRFLPKVAGELRYLGITVSPDSQEESPHKNLRVFIKKTNNVFFYLIKAKK